MFQILEFEVYVYLLVGRFSKDQRKEFHTLEDLGLDVTDQFCYTGRQRFWVVVKREVLKLIWCTQEKTDWKEIQ